MILIGRSTTLCKKKLIEISIVIQIDNENSMIQQNHSKMIPG